MSDSCNQRWSDIFIMQLRRQREYRNKNVGKDQQLCDILTLFVAHVCAPGKDQFFHSVFPSHLKLCYFPSGHSASLLSPVVLLCALFLSLLQLLTNMARRQTTKQASLYSSPACFALPSPLLLGVFSLFWLHWLLFVWPSFRDRTLIQLDCCVIVSPLSGDSLQSLSLIL